MINIADILKPLERKGIKINLFSPLIGNCRLIGVSNGNSDHPIQVIKDDHVYRFDSYGRFFANIGQCILFPSEDCHDWEVFNLTMTTPFQKGTWVVMKNGKSFSSGNFIEQVVSVEYDSTKKFTKVWLSTGTWIEESKIRLWDSNEDLKDGDILVTKTGCPFIFDKFRNPRLDVAYYYAGIDGNGSLVVKCPEKMLYHFGPIAEVAPATKEQRDMLFSKIEEEGYSWDSSSKQLTREYTPRFSPNTWVTNGVISLCITSIDNGRYYFLEGGCLKCEDVDQYYHIWTIDDADDGDTIATPNGNVFIFKCLEGEEIKDHCGLYFDKFESTPSSPNGCLIPAHECGYFPATFKQTSKLFRKMEEAGYRWDSLKNKLIEIDPHYDISKFEGGMPVLVRDSDSIKWTLDLFSFVENGLFVCTSRIRYRQCIPFKDNESLLGMTKPCDKKYINW